MKPDPSEPSDMIDNDFKKDIREGVQGLKTRVSVLEQTSDPLLKERVAILENTTDKQGITLEELRRLFAVSDATMTHHATLAAEQQKSLVRHFEARLDSLKAEVKALFDIAFANHEKREGENLSRIVDGNNKIQKSILVSIVMLLLSVLGALAYFILEHVPMTS